MKLIRNTVLALTASAIASPVLAADTGYTQEAIESAFDVAFGATLTSRYMSRGVDFSDGVALQGYIEPSYGIFYAGAWFSTVGGPNVDPDDDVEFNLYLGVRPEFGSLALDLGYVRYLYNDTGDCCGELYAKATYSFTETLSAGAEIYFDPEADTTYGALNASVGLPYDFTLSAAVGTWLNSGDDDVDWNVGISYTFEEKVTLDARYHDSNFGPGRFVASISFDTSWSALRRR